jgi:hypothetical protein
MESPTAPDAAGDSPVRPPDPSREEWLPCMSRSGLEVDVDMETASASTAQNSAGGGGFYHTETPSISSASTFATTQTHEASDAGRSWGLSGTALTTRQKFERSVRRFFQKKDRMKRLKTIVDHEYSRIFELLHYFTVRYGQVGLQTESGFCSPKAAYDLAITNNTKRFFDFKERRTPNTILVQLEGGPLMPLGQLVALMWFIQMGFDKVFWDRFEEVKRRFVQFSTSKKQSYTQTHRQKYKKRKEMVTKSLQMEQLRKTQSEAAERGEKNLDAVLTSWVPPSKLVKEEMDKLKLKEREERQARNKKGAAKRGAKRKRGKDEARAPPQLMDVNAPIKI